MIYNVRILVYIYVMVVIFSTYTYAPWKTQPRRPKDSKLGNCYKWLTYYGFKDNNVNNRILANTRDQEYDQDVFYFAAAFAYFLNNTSNLYDINNFGISEFCDLHTLHNATYPFIALKDAEFTCERWIDLYLYPEERDSIKYYNPKAHFNNFLWATCRDEMIDTKISLWAALYFLYITSDPSNEFITPRGFCLMVGKPIMTVPHPKNYPFMIIDGSRMSCIEWKYLKTLDFLSENVIAEENSTSVTKLPFRNIATECYEMIIYCGLSDDKLINVHIIYSKLVDEKSVNIFAKYYINYIKGMIRSNNESILEPKEFCNSWTFFTTDIFLYFGLE